MYRRFWDLEERNLSHLLCCSYVVSPS
jgi:hypothetical protein